MACPAEGTKFNVQGEEFESVGRTTEDGRCIFRGPDGQLTVFQAEASTKVRAGMSTGTKAALIIGGLVALTAVVEHGVD